MPFSAVRQAAALPVRDGLVCMVTSRSGRRWVVPKGRVEPGQTHAEAALAEAWEEAGLSGVIDGDAVGTYHYEKDDRDHHVTVYVMRVTQEADRWPERSARRREWVTEDEAVDRADEPALKHLIREVFRLGRVPGEEVAAG